MIHIAICILLDVRVNFPNYVIIRFLLSRPIGQYHTVQDCLSPSGSSVLDLRSPAVNKPFVLKANWLLCYEPYIMPRGTL